jgi:hypothetical protein
VDQTFRSVHNLLFSTYLTLEIIYNLASKVTNENNLETGEIQTDCGTQFKGPKPV